MGDGTEPMTLDDTSWRYYCESAKAEIDQDIDAALLRCARGESTLADAVMLAGYCGHGHLFETRINGRLSPTIEDAE